MKTIKDIAVEANVSPGTVDRVIHNRAGVSPKTKVKIQNLLEKYNFERNLLASTLAYKKKYTIATLIPFSDFKNDFWSEPKKGFESAINEIKRYRVVTHCFYFDKFDLKTYKKAFNEVLELNPDGVVLAPFFYRTSINFAKILSQKNIPFVFINIDIECLENLTFIGQDSYQSGLMSGKLLNLVLDKQDQIAIVRSRKNVDNHHSIDARTKGFLDFFTKNNGHRHIHEIYFEAFSQVEIGKVLTNELIKNNLIKGVFVPSSASFFVAHYLESVALDDIHLVGFDTHISNLKYLKNGAIDFLIDQGPFNQGYIGMKVLFEYLLFNKKPKKIYSSPINIVTQENADYFRKSDYAKLVDEPNAN